MAKTKARTTIADVARQANVSSMTVSRVINDKGEVSETTRKRVLDVMRKLAYRPNRVARSLASDRTLKIGVLVPSISSAYFSSVLESAEHVFWNNNYHMLLCNAGKNDRREQDVLEFFEEDCVDGVLIFASYLECEPLSELLANQRAAVVFNTEVDPKVAGQILFDEHAGIVMAMEHLLDQGRRHLAYVGLPKRTFATRERISAFRQVLTRLGRFDPALIVNTDDEDDVDAAVARLLCDKPNTDGILCFNDEVAAHVLRACAELGKRVPEDVAIIGYDDTEIASLVTPRLTTLRLTLSNDELGALAAQMLLDRIDGQVNQQPITLSHDLVIRESTA